MLLPVPARYAWAATAVGSGCFSSQRLKSHMAKAEANPEAREEIKIGLSPARGAC
jgi:hypothetical protein